MPKILSSDHPRQCLLFFVAQDINDELRQKVKAFVQRISKAREWVIKPPRFVDSAVEADRPEVDLPVVTLGGLLELYSAYPGTNLPKDVDRQHLEEVEFLVKELQTFSQENALAVEFELDQTFVGSIEDGILDRSLREGLLGAWRKHLETKKE